MFRDFRYNLILRSTRTGKANIDGLVVIIFQPLKTAEDLAYLIRGKQGIGCERFQQELVFSHVTLLDDGSDPIFTIRGRLNQPAFTVGLVPVMSIEPIQRNAAPL